MANIAFIGLGNMGGPMAANLVKAGHKVSGFDLVAASREQAKADGVAIAESSVAAVKDADVVVTMLPAGKHVLSVWNEVLPAMTKGALIIDCSTIDVESASRRTRSRPSTARSRSTRRSPAASAAPRARRSPSWAAARTRPSRRQSRCWRRWARRSCIAAAPAPGRRRRSATT